MALADDLLKGSTLIGVAIGVGAALLTPVLKPVARPAARAAVKTGVILYEKSCEAVAEVAEVVDDLVAEAKADLQRAREARQGDDDMAGPASGAGADTHPAGRE